MRLQQFAENLYTHAEDNAYLNDATDGFRHRHGALPLPFPNEVRYFRSSDRLEVTASDNPPHSSMSAFAPVRTN